MCRHLKGQGVREDHKKALKLLKSASQQGNSEALYNLGVVYMGAYGDEPDYTSAMQHFQVAAQHSHTLALHKLGQVGLNPTCDISEDPILLRSGLFL